VERKQKEYRQSDQLYLVVTMADRSGKTYALVFRKEKKANQAAQTTPGLRPAVSDL
jgi:hypothetical protein